MFSRLALACALVYLLTIPAIAQSDTPQESPALVGTWVLRIPNAEVLPLPGIKSQRIAITCVGNQVEISATTNGEESAVRFVANGEERRCRAIPPLSSAEVVGSRREGTSLVVTMVRGSWVTGVSTITERWTPSLDGRTLTRSWDEFKTPAVVYDKQPIKLFPIIRGGKFGFIDQTGHVVISPRFLWASEFSEGRAAVFICHKYGYIDESGKIVIPPRFDGAGKFSEGLALVLIGKKVGFIDETGRMAIAAVYDSAFEFADGEDGVYVEGREGLIDKTGRWLVPNHFDELLGFSEGVSAALQGNRWGFVDKSGRTVIPFEFKSAGSFADGRAHVTTFAGQDDLIDHSGHIIIQDANTAWGFSEGFAPVQLHGEDSYRYIDVSGKVAIAGPFDTALPFSEGLAAVQIGEEWGYIDHTGKATIQPQFKAAHDFSHGLAAVKLDNRWGVIDKTGKFVVKPQFAEILGAPGEFLQVSITKDEWGYVDPQGKLFWRGPESERPRYFEHNPLEGLTQEEINASCKQPSRQIPPNDAPTPD